MSESKKAVYAALFGNLAIAVTKFAAAGVTGSSSMLSEAVHSLVDTGNEGLLLYGYRRAARPPDERHPLGYGRELYFWSFIVALLLFALGAGVSLYEGVAHIASPKPIEDPLVSYIVLAFSFVFEGASWFIALKTFHRQKGELGWWEAVRRSKDPPAFMVLFEDSAALLGLLAAAAGIWAAQAFDEPAYDGAASIVIALILAVTAAILAREAKGLLIGERADEAVVDSIRRLAEAEPGIVRTNGIMTVHLAPDQVVAALSIEFEDELRTPEIEERVIRLENSVRQRHPELLAIFIKPQTRDRFLASRR